MTEVTAQDRLSVIFRKQASLMDKYEQIEKDNGHHRETMNWSSGLDINDRFDQARIKDTAWRITEEIAETFDALETPSFKEELVDILHFLTEISILSNLTYEYVVTYQGPGDTLDWVFLNAQRNSPVMVRNMYGKCDNPSFAYVAAYFIRALGMACNCLKNKPWKQTDRNTDMDLYISRIQETWSWYANLCLVAGVHPSDLVELYIQKNKINQQRQENGY